MSKVKAIAFYLPQYHPIPENDEWWGKGFTEWTNVRKARPLFSGHHQPSIPAELGYYDLRDSHVRDSQAELAMKYGLYGFCYYHYWFNGKLLLEAPFNEVLNSGKPDFPFCLCWANENWTRIWDGQNKNILMEQKYSEEDDKRHIAWLIKAFRDKRYIRIDGKPLFLVYKISAMADSLKTTTIWREEARKAGIGELYLCKVESFLREKTDPKGTGFDAAVQFPPNSVYISAFSKLKLMISKKIIKRSFGDVYDYNSFAMEAMKAPCPSYKEFLCVMPKWDNSPRRSKGGRIYINNDPRVYGEWLKKSIDETMVRFREEERLVFINAWNEWGEGNYLEPCARYGRTYLEETARALGLM
ncbi:MAG TPA: glycoside hydrolase family 99-like domain-containing protein [Candidatus Omnitrophota bacterium]|nr:glycoside hydrolase family 99-like domain-containing protein [Candidatus Omnitrophota bacterium]